MTPPGNPAAVDLPESLHSKNLKSSLHFIANFPATNNKPVDKRSTVIPS